MQRGCDSLIDVLKAQDVQYIFGVPGESFTPFMDALHDEPQITWVTARQEGGAAFMAEAWAGASGSVGVVLGARAVGAANLSIGIHTAMENSTPMVVLLGQVKSSLRGRQGFQEIDLDRFMAPLCKWAIEITDPTRIQELMQRAFRTAVSGRPGPVAVSLPEDILAASIDSPRVAPTPMVRPRPAPATHEIETFLGHLRQARRPLIIAGAGIKRAGAENALKAVAERFGVPVVAAWRRHDAFPNQHPLYVGHLQMGTHPDLIGMVRRADTIFVIGSRLNEITTQGGTLIRPEQKIVQLDIESSVIATVYPVAQAIVADARIALERLREAPAIEAPAAEPGWSRECREVWERITLADSPRKIEGVDNRAIIRMLRDALPESAILTNDAGNFAGWMHTFFRFEAANTYVGAASGAMGYAMPAAIGAQLANPDKRVVSLSGDGGFMMTVQELETAVRLRLPIVCLVFNNNMYGSIRMHQEKAHPGRVIGSELGNPDFVALANAFGARGMRVTDHRDFPIAIEQALNGSGPVVIEIVNDPEQISVSQTIADLRRRANSAMEGE